MDEITTNNNKATRQTLTVHECVELFGGSAKFWYNRVNAGEVKTVRIGKLLFIDRAALYKQLGLEDK